MFIIQYDVINSFHSSDCSQFGQSDKYNSMHGVFYNASVFHASVGACILTCKVNKSASIGYASI